MVNKYQKHKEELRKEACERYQNLSEEEKGNKVEYIKNFYLFIIIINTLFFLL